MNCINIMGRLTGDPILKVTGTGRSVTEFAIAVDDGYGDNKKTYFFKCVAWQHTADFISKYFTKGQQIALTGKLTRKQYETQQGENKTVTKIVVQDVSFYGTKPQNRGNADDNSLDYLNDVPDDLPF